MTKFYHIFRDGWIWIVAFANGQYHWLYRKAPVGHCMR